MSLNRRKSSNQIEVRWMAKLVFSAAFAALLGITYAMVMNRLHDYAEVRRGLERQLKELREERRVLDAHIARLSSRSMIEERLATGFIKMQPIEDARIIRLHMDVAGQHPAHELRAVANEFRLP